MADDDNLLVRALFQGRSLDTIRFLVEETPHCLRHRNEQGCLPLHRVFDINPLPHPDIFRCLVEQYLESVRERTNTGSLPLHLACAYPSRFPDLVREDLNRLAQMIEVLVGRWPESLRERTVGWELPLHLACRSTCGVTVDDAAVASLLLRSLAEPWPESLREKNVEGQLAVHCTLLQGRPWIALLRCVIEASPQALQVPDHRGLIPLHYAVANSVDVAAVRCMLEQWPPSIQVRDRDGRIPLHIAAMNDAPLDVIYVLLSAWLSPVIEM